MKNIIKSKTNKIACLTATYLDNFFLGKMWLIGFLFLLTINKNFAQNIFSGEPVQVVGQMNGYSTAASSNSGYRRVSVGSGTPTDGRGQWVKTYNVQSSGGDFTPRNMTGGGGSGFIFITGPSSNRFQNKWAFSGVGSASVNAVNGISAFNSGNDMGLNMSTAGRYTFVFNDVGYTQTNAKFYVAYTSNAPVTVTRSSQTLNFDRSANLGITTSATPSSGENIYVRYTTSTDFTTSSTVVQATGSGTSWTATIPSQTIGSTVRYFVFGSTISLASLNGMSEIDKSLSVINYDDNSGSNFSYTLTSSYTSSQTGNFNTSSTWGGSQLFDGASYTIANTHTVTLNANTTISGITINSGGTFVASDATPRTLTIASGGTITNNGTFTAGTGTVAFAGSGTVSGTVNFNIVTIAGGVNFGTASAIGAGGSMQINAGGFVSTNAPTYNSASTLIYNTGGTYGRGTEWSTASGAGYPGNVQIGNGVATTLDVVNGSNSYKKAAGNLTVNTGSTFSVPSLTAGLSGVGVEFLGNLVNDGTITLSGTTNQRLKVANFTNGNSNSTATTTLASNVGADLELTGSYLDNANFTANQRAIFFTGTGTQTISGTATAPFNIDYIVVTKASGIVQLGVDLLTGAPNGGNGLTLSSAADILDLNGRTFTLGTAAQTCNFSGSGVIRSSSGSPGSMIINGTGPMGTLTFETANNTLAGLTINRTAGTGTPGVTLGSALTVTTTLALTSTTTLTLGGNLTVSASGSNSVAGRIAGTGALIKTGVGTLTFSAASGNNTAHTYSAGTTLNGAGTGTISVTGLANITSASITSAAQSVTFSSTTPANGTYQLLPGTLTVGTQSFTHNADATKAVTFNYTNSTVTVASATITTSSITPTTYCAGGSVSVPFTTTGPLTGTYTAQLSDATGSFASPVAIGTNTASPISATIPGGASAGTGYRIRVVSLTIPITGSDNGTNITINVPPTSLNYTSNTVSYCVGTAISTNSPTFTGTAATGYSVSPSLPADLSLNATTGDITGNPTVAAAAANYTVTVTNACGTTTRAVNIAVNAVSTVAVISGTASICPGSSTNLSVAITGGTSPFTVVYTNGTSNFTVNSYTSGTAIPVSPTTTTTYSLVSVTSTGGCTGIGNSGSAVVTVGTTSTWNGSAWSPSTPNSTSAVVFEGNYTAASNLTFCSVSVASGTVTIPSGYNLTLNGAITVTGGSFVLANNANLIQNTNVANSGNITVNRNTAALMRQDYCMWSSPVSGQQLQAFSPLTLSNRFYTYDPATDTYVTETATNNFSTGKGYLIRLPNNHPTTPTVWNGSFSGTPNNGTVALTSLTSSKYYAIGNPYASAISADDFIFDNSLSEAIYFWRKTNNADNSSYATYSLAGGVSNSGGDPIGLIPNGFIQVGQGFIAKVPASASSLTFTNTMRVADNSNQFLRRTEDRSRYWLNLTNDQGYFAQMMVAYMPNATNGFDAAIDGLYFNDSPTALTSTIDSQEYVIQARALPFEATDVVALGFKSELAGTYTIALNSFDGTIFDTNNQAIYLKDNLTNTVQDLRAGSYTFTTEPGVFNNRFEVRYDNFLSADMTSLSANTVAVYKQNQEIVVNSGNIKLSKVQIYDIRGRLLVEKSNIDGSEVRLTAGTANQVVLVKVTSVSNEVVTKKVIN